MTQKHTPGRWSCDRALGRIQSIDDNGKSHCVGTLMLHSDDSEYVVRAVNAHEALVQACEILMNAAEYFRVGNRSGGTMGLISTAMDAAESALRAARGE